MPEYTLTAQPTLGGFKKSFDGVALEELTSLAIVSIAVPLGGDDAVALALNTGYGATHPKPGEASLSEDGKTRFLGISKEQMFAIFERIFSIYRAIRNPRQRPDR